MIEITIRLKPGRATAFASLLRAIADMESDRGQAKRYRGAARQIERLPKATRSERRRPTRSTSGRPKLARTAPTRPASAPRPLRYTPRVQRPKHQEIDEGAVQRVVLGIHPLPVLTREEARLACWHLTGRGCSAPEIAERLFVAQRTVHRWRAEDQQAVAA